MESKERRWHLRLKNYNEALNALQEGAAQYERLNELEKDGLIQRFEFTFELAWKVMQDYLKETGYSGLRGPRPSITQMGADGFIDPFVWSEIVEARNELSHVYNEEKSRSYLDRIIFDFLPAFTEFKSKMLSV